MHIKDQRIGVIGLGFVGGAIFKYFKGRGSNVVGYDLYKESSTFADVLETDVVFLCLPTMYSEEREEYNKKAIISSCGLLQTSGYAGVVVVKSTVEPGTTDRLVTRYPSLRLIHNPEFLTAATAERDFAEQRHIVLGSPDPMPNATTSFMQGFYDYYFRDAETTMCTSNESELMKISANAFYAVKIQYFTEIHAMCQGMGADFNKVRDMIVNNGWVNPMHTKVPGTDGKVSYGGLCFPKDTSALVQQMKRMRVPHAVLEATIAERNTMRPDSQNCETYANTEHSAGAGAS